MNMTIGLGSELASEPKLIYHCACNTIQGKGHITQIDVAEEDSNIQVLNFYYCLVEKNLSQLQQSQNLENLPQQHSNHNIYYYLAFKKVFQVTTQMQVHPFFKVFQVTTQIQVHPFF